MDHNYQSSSSSNGGNKELEGFQYPTENLGTSWGSYLQSGPPTRAGLAGAHKKSPINHTETVNEELAEKGIPVNIKRSKPKVVVFDPFTQARDTSQPTTTSTPEVHPASKSNKSKELQTHQENSEPRSESDTNTNYKTPKNSLLKEMQKLMEDINTSQQEIAKNGTNTDRLKALISAKDKTYSDLRQLVCDPISGNGVEVLSTGVLVDVIHYLAEVLNSLVQQSQKLLQDADSLQRSGRQLSKNQDRFFRDQHEIYKAIEEARMQLIREKNAFKEEIAVKQENMERLQLALRQQVPTKAQKQTPKLGTVHEVMQGRNQMAALLQTQKEQAKLEKLLFRQQRDIQRIQRDLENTKSELLSAQDHALKLEHKIVSHRRKVMPGQPREHIAQALTRKADRKAHKTTDTGLRGVLTAQSTLDREMLRIKKQIEEQQIRERLLSKHLEVSYQSLTKRAVTLRQQAAGIKGKSLYVPSDETDYGDDDRQQAQRQRKRKTHIPKLPQLPKQEARVRKKPTYTFSKQELVTLACFSDEEATDNVMEWLEMQGNLVD